MNLTHRALFFLASLGVAGTLLAGGVAFAQTTTPGPTQHAGWGRWHTSMGAHGILGTVASVSGTTLTVTTKAGPNGTPAAATYSVNASNATVTKNGSTSTVAAIQVGDTVIVRGTVSGTSVSATAIRDGIPARGKGMANLQSTVQGNGEPVIGGSVTAISGTTLTVAPAKGNISYSVDASSATVEKGGATSTVSAIAIGDQVTVQGAVNGTSVKATSVIDQGVPPASSSTSPGIHAGFFGMIGGFFQRLFGFL